ncbi:MAG TPA: nitroreductase/quinone reductase family protein [Gaiellaceae bacterium]|nr:nitroreductase/quinone reductase family protein [Gaiellaceae bacterium]
MNPYASAVRALGRTRPFAWVASRVLHRIDLRVPLSSAGTGFPVAYVTATGRRSGEPRTVPLLYADWEDDSIVVAATNWGKATHPAWALNVDAKPDVLVATTGRPRPMRARRAVEEERPEAWRRLERIWPGYAGYRRRAGRDIPVFVLEPEARPARRRG